MSKKYYMEQNSEKAANKSRSYRKERKFIINELGSIPVEAILRSHPAMFSRAYPSRHVNNIYFDTSNFQNYSDNIVGSADRHKFRIRWYGEQMGLISKPILEIKIKKGLAGTKMSYPLAPFRLENGISQQVIQQAIDRSDIPMELRTLMKRLSPSLLNRYYRKYFHSADRKFRITLDSNLSFTHISWNKNYFMRRIVNDDKIVLELKYNVENDLIAGWISGHFPFRLSKNSKYVNGVQNLDVW